MRRIILCFLLSLFLNFAARAIEPERVLAIVNESVAYYNANSMIRSYLY